MTLKNLSEGYPLACAIWDDAHGSASGEFTAAEIARDHHDPALIRTFGLLIHEDERGVTIAQEITSAPDEDLPTFRGLGFIPRGMLRELIVLGVPKRPGAKRRVGRAGRRAQPPAPHEAQTPTADS
jgi:hypothetical protein